MLRVLTYSVRRATGNALSAVAQVLRAQQPDAVALIEPPAAAQIDALARALAMRAVYAQQDSPPLAWLCRLPIVGGQSYDYLTGARAMLRLDADWQGQRVSLFAVHLRTGATDRDEHVRAREVVALLEYLPRVLGEPHLLVGDFSALHPMDTVAPRRLLGVMRRAAAEEKVERRAIPLLLDAGYTDCFRAMHRGASRVPGYTYPAPHPRRRTDYIFASAQLARRLVACDAVSAPPADAASDHYPVLAEIL